MYTAAGVPGFAAVVWAAKALERIAINNNAVESRYKLFAISKKPVSVQSKK
jgi:hypothetical protein